MDRKMRFAEGRIKVLGPVVAMGLVLPLAGCGSGSGSPALGSAARSTSGSGQGQSTAATQQAGSSAPAAAEGGGSSGSSSQELLAAAEKEGSLTWYTSFSDKEVKGIQAAFSKVYPSVKLTYLQGSIDKLTARINTEQKGGKYDADLVQGSATYTVQLAKSGALQPYEPPADAAPPAVVQLPAGYRNVDFLLTDTIDYNPAALKKQGLSVPTSYADFTKPDWKGKFSVDDRDVGLYESLINEVGHDKALALVKAIGANDPRIVESHSQAATQVESGEPAATIAAYGYKAGVTKKKNPAAFDFVNPTPLPVSADTIELVKNAPHPAAAKLFMNWFLSQEGQTAIVSITGRTSLRDDVGNDPAVWNPSTWKPVWSSPSLPAATFNQYTQEFKAALGAQ
jgi:iron(III) transport system substrate-binding protein